MTAGTVLVTGASGYAAQFVVQDYVQRGWQVRCGQPIAPKLRFVAAAAAAAVAAHHV